MNFIDKYKNKGLSGLSNLGNTCFVNSCMQILSHTYELNELLNTENFKKKLKNKYDSALLLEWDNLRQLLWSNNCIISPGKFIKTIQKLAHIKGMDMFTGYSQNDLPEFLLFIIDCFHNSLSRDIKMTISGEVENETDTIATKCFEMIKNMYSKEYSEIWNLFYAVHVSEIRTLEGENSWLNDETNERINIKKRIQFWSFPNILTIDFKRFNSRNQKNQILISFPLDNLDLSKYVIGYKKNSYIYELYGVCNHSGGVLGGHYTAYVKNANGKWYHFNDTSVIEIGLVDSIISPKAYCLFYRKKCLS